MLNLKRKALLVSLATAMLAASCGSNANTIAIGPKIGTEGIGLEGRVAIQENFIARLGVNHLHYKHTYHDVDLRYKGKLHLLTVPLMLDFHPMPGSGFRISGGVAYNDNHLSATATPQPTQAIRVNGRTYVGSQIGTVNTKLKLGNKFAGLASIGYDSSIVSLNPLGFSFELGLMFSGNPKLRVSGTGLVAGSQELKDAEADARRALDDIRKYLRYWPVLSIGVKYSF